MKDGKNFTLGEKQEVFTLNLAKLIIYAASIGYKSRLREVERTAYQQEEYIKRGKSRTMESRHLKSLAADIYFTKGDLSPVETKHALLPLGEYWESLHPLNRWGGNFKDFQDCPHFEMG
jgi:peptidoglycan L-alanyl-D-glutamate endopeptidase CwlK